MGAGKSQWRLETARLLEATAACINNEPDRECLVIHHLPDDSRSKAGAIPDIPKALADLLTTKDKVYCRSWGLHKQTNQYKDLDKLVLAGLLYLPQSVIEIRGRGSMRKQHDDDLSAKDYKAIEIGEWKNDILQAVGRICVRRCDCDQAPKADIYIIASNRSGATISDLLQETFPGCTVKRFTLPGMAKEKWELALDYIKLFYTNPGAWEARLPISQVREAIGVRNASNYKRLVRDNPYLKKALKDALIEEAAVGKRISHYRKLPF